MGIFNPREVSAPGGGWRAALCRFHILIGLSDHSSEDGNLMINWLLHQSLTEGLPDLGELCTMVRNKILGDAMERENVGNQKVGHL